MERVETMVRQFVRFEGYGIPTNERDDLVQEVLLQIWQAVTRPQFDPAQSLDPFIRAVACRRCIDWRRRRRAMVDLVEEMPDERKGPEELTSESERLRVGCRVLARLSPSCRNLIRLHAVEGLTYARIAAILRRSEGALRVQMHGCLKSAQTIRAGIEGER